jgi:hypothetical protein
MPSRLARVSPRFDLVGGSRPVGFRSASQRLAGAESDFRVRELSEKKRPLPGPR